MARYSIYPGKFRCHVCGIEVATVRSYEGQRKISWMCPERHLSEVSLETKRTKRDYEREE